MKGRKRTRVRRCRGYKDEVEEKRKKAEWKVMKQQNQMNRCSQWMIGGPRCL